MPIGIVLSGGGAKGDFQVGALRFLYNQGIRPDILTGTSVGAINVAKLAEGENPADPTLGLTGLERIWESLQRNSDMYVDEAWDRGGAGWRACLRAGDRGRAGIELQAPAALADAQPRPSARVREQARRRHTLP